MQFQYTGYWRNRGVHTARRPSWDDPVTLDWNTHRFQGEGARMKVALLNMVMGGDYTAYLTFNNADLAEMLAGLMADDRRYRETLTKALLRRAELDREEDEDTASEAAEG